MDVNRAFVKKEQNQCISASGSSCSGGAITARLTATIILVVIILPFGVYAAPAFGEQRRPMLINFRIANKKKGEAMTEQIEAVEACENGTATVLQQRCVARYFREAWAHEGANAERLAAQRDEITAKLNKTDAHIEECEQRRRKTLADNDRLENRIAVLESELLSTARWLNSQNSVAACRVAGKLFLVIGPIAGRPPEVRP